WCERMESVFYISNCAAENQVKFATCTLHSVALTWWNTHVQTIGHESAYGMSWKMLMKMMTDKYCPQNEIRKLEMQLWELKLLAGRLNMLFRDRRAHAHTRLLMKAEAMMSREAWTRAIDACDLVHGEVTSLRTTVL
nr:reverse transcriptase domain-containing protein [Tanacetum cinerariifolium]